MAKMLGRKVKVYRGTGGSRVPFAGGRVDTLSFNDEMIEITDKYDNGVRTLLDESALISCDISVEGLLDGDDPIVRATATTSRIGPYEIDIDDYGTISGSFRYGATEIGSPYNEATTYTITLNSTGAFIYTPAP